MISIEEMASRGDFVQLKTYLQTHLVSINKPLAEALFSLVDQFRLDLIADLLKIKKLDESKMFGTGERH